MLGIVGDANLNKEWTLSLWVLQYPLLVTGEKNLHPADMWQVEYIQDKVSKKDCSWVEWLRLCQNRGVFWMDLSEKLIVFW